MLSFAQCSITRGPEAFTVTQGSPKRVYDGAAPSLNSSAPSLNHYCSIVEIFRNVCIYARKCSIICTNCFQPYTKIFHFLVCFVVKNNPCSHVILTTGQPLLELPFKFIFIRQGCFNLKYCRTGFIHPIDSGRIQNKGE